MTQDASFEQLTSPEKAFRVVDHGGNTVLTTDDWVEAEALCLLPAVGAWPATRRTIRGTHSTHDWDEQTPRRCRTCIAIDNTSYGSHAPCGYDWQRDSLYSAVCRELEARGSSLGELRPDLERVVRGRVTTDA